MKAIIPLALGVLLALPEIAFAQAPPVRGFGNNSADGSGWLAGAHVGYNWQRGSVVFGVESDISGTGLKSAMSTTLQSALAPPPTALTSSSIDWYGTVRGRLGWASGPLMFYGTGGVAYGRTSLNSTLDDQRFAQTLISQASAYKTGWVAGAGAEYLIRPNLIASFNYQYVDLGRTSLAATSPNLSLSQTVNSSGRFQVVSLGLSFLFPAPGPAVVDRPQYAKAPAMAVADPWSGVYAGVHGGGAWGNRTDANYSQAFFLFSDARLKRDVTLIGRRDDGLGVYSYRYIWSDTVYTGALAQEVALLYPRAVIRDPLTGYLAVNYSSLGMRPVTDFQ